LENRLLNRRKFLQCSASLLAVGSGLALVGCGDSSTADAAFKPYPNDPVRPENFSNPLFVPGGEGPFGVLSVTDLPLTLNARTATFPILGGRASPFLLYETSYAGKTYQNPIFKIKRGGRFAATLQNGLNEPTIIHWHGLHIPANMDGHPIDSIGPGANYRYDFTVNNRGGTYWYHTHAQQLTAKQAYGGLASFFIVEDDDDLRLSTALDLKLGETDLPLVIQDKRFNAAGELVYQPTAMEQMMGYLGDIVLVNLTPNPVLEIAPRIYRFRCLNGSNARIYKLAFMRGTEQLAYHVIGTDGGLLDRPYPVKEVFLAPGERLDVLFDASQLPQSETVFLKSLAFEPMENEGAMGMMGSFGGMFGKNSMAGMDGSARLDEELEFNLLKLVVTKPAPAPRPLPARLSQVQPINITGATPRAVRLEMGHMRWLINGASFRMDEFPIDARRNSVEVWDLHNAEHSMPHPMHMHGFQFQVLSRQNSPKQIQTLGVHGSGRLVSDLGWKDTVLVWPGETVRLAVDFSHDFEGDQTYVFHCHNLEHEDGDMMVNMRVRT
jgi:blue copper oxidase